MIDKTVTDQNRLPQAFIDLAGVELSRAERYRVFVSLTVFDLSMAHKYAGERYSETLEDLGNLIAGKIRACDHSSYLGEHCLGVLFPETSRQGAEIAAKRLSNLLKSRIHELTGETVAEVIPVEMASYPDSAGAKALSSILEEIAQKSLN